MMSEIILMQQHLRVTFSTFISLLTISFALLAARLVSVRALSRPGSNVCKQNGQQVKDGLLATFAKSDNRILATEYNEPALLDGNAEGVWVQFSTSSGFFRIKKTAYAYNYKESSHKPPTRHEGKNGNFAKKSSQLTTVEVLVEN